MSHWLRFPDCPGKAYLRELERDFDHVRPDSQAAFLRALGEKPAAEIVASKFMARSLALVDGSPHIFFANFAGLHGGGNPVQTPQTGVRVPFRAKPESKAFFLPFLGEVQEVKGVASHGRRSYILPAITKGAVFWSQTGPAEKHSE
jgi:hypothetical protein